MKKALIIVFVAALVIGLTACSQEKFAATLGKMGNNVYGIKPDVRVSNEAASKVESSVTSDEYGNYDVKLGTAVSVVDYVGTISNSPKKAEALRARLETPVSTADAAQVRVALSMAAGSIVTDYADSISEDRKPLLDAMEDVIVSYKAVVSDSESKHVPTYADVAVLSIIDMLNDALKDGVDNNVLLEKGMEAVNAIKLISDIGDVDVMGKLDISKFFDAPKSVARAENRSLQAFASTMSSVVRLVTKDGKFNNEMYRSFICKAKVFKAAYDMAICGAGFDGSFIDFIDLDGEGVYPTLKVNLGLVADDLGRYLVITSFVAMDRINDILSNAWTALLGAYFNENYEALLNFGKYKLKPVSEATIMTFMDNLGNDVLTPALHDEEDPESYKYASDGTFDDKIASIVEGFLDMVLSEETVFDLSKAPMRFFNDVMDMLNASVVIIIDTDYGVLLKMAGSIISGGIDVLLEGLMGDMDFDIPEDEESLYDDPVEDPVEDPIEEIEEG